MNEVATAALRGHACENRGTVIRTSTDNEQSTAISFASINANWGVSASISRATVFDVGGPRQIGCMNGIAAARSGRGALIEALGGNGRDLGQHRANNR